MRVFALAFVALACAVVASCSGKPSRVAHCPAVHVRLTSDGTVFAGDCRNQIAARTDDAGRAVREILDHPPYGPIIEWTKFPPIILDIDDDVSLADAQTLLNRLQDAGFYRVELSDGPARPTIPVKLPPMFGGPFHTVVVIVQPSHDLSFAVADLTFGGAAPHPPLPRFDTLKPNDLSKTLSGLKHGSIAYVGGASELPWKEVRPVYRTLVAQGADEFVGWTPPPPTATPPSPPPGRGR